MLALENHHLSLTKVITDSDQDHQQMILKSWEVGYSHDLKVPPHKIHINYTGKGTAFIFYFCCNKSLQIYWLEQHKFIIPYYIGQKSSTALHFFAQGLTGIKIKVSAFFFGYSGEEYTSKLIQVVSRIQFHAIVRLKSTFP